MKSKSKESTGGRRAANLKQLLTRRTVAAALLAGCVASPVYAQRAADAAPELDGKTVYQLLLGEIALQRGESGIAAEAYGEVARRTKDPAALGRAMQVAVVAKRLDLALEYGRAWVEVEPKSLTARHA